MKKDNGEGVEERKEHSLPALTELGHNQQTATERHLLIGRVSIFDIKCIYIKNIRTISHFSAGEGARHMS